MRILLAIDGSESSTPAIQAVLARGSHQATEVRVLQFVKVPSLLGLGNMGGYDVALAEAWDEETEQAHVLVAKIAEVLRSYGMKVSTSVEQGNSESTIIHASEKWQADLIVLGAPGQTGLGRLWMGGVPAAVALRARCSVEIARVTPGSEGPAPITRREPVWVSNS
jgi:nucleotide-binding universal stress UspA family protein